jgi:hypothetical protein
VTSQRHSDDQQHGSSSASESKGESSD